ncbi:MAG: response regulator [Akkermansiaceae bacterium]|nr:response regulator [Akkermansiaceae bacterium]MDP4898762.1 response regulator [Akkermansiaceae bacterium]
MKSPHYIIEKPLEKPPAPCCLEGELSVIVVEDDPIAAKILIEALRGNGVHPSLHTHGSDALRELASSPSCRAILIDLSLPDMEGMDLLREARRINPGLACFILTARNHVESAVTAMKAGALDYFTKPFDLPKVVTTVRETLKTINPKLNKNFILRDDHWKSKAMLEAIRLADIAAASDKPLLISGPNHSGKTYFARNIHTRRQEKPSEFITVDLVSLTAKQAEIVLFGANLQQADSSLKLGSGLLYSRSKLTVCIRSVDRLSPLSQTLLLGWLKLSSEINTPHRTTIRLITTTSEDLSQLVAKQLFVSDLFYALSTYHIWVPGLAERVEDIPQLSEDIITSICVEQQRKRPTLTPQALEILSDHIWPGNVSELWSVLSHAMAVTKDGLITEADLPNLNSLIASNQKISHLPKSVMSIDDLNRAALVSTLEACGGNRRRAAKKLKVSLRTVYNMIKRYDL